MMRSFALLLALSGTAAAWDFRGHRVVVQVACDYMAPATREWVEHCLQEHPDPRARTLDGAAVWPDMVRDERPETMPWHFINLPLGQGPQPLERDHVVWAIENNREAVCISGDGAKRAQAMAFLLHLVGDVHQPLHAANYYSLEYPEGDQGGGRVALIHPWAKSLHHYWDSGGEPPELTQDELKAKVARSPGGPDAHCAVPKVWAEESHRWAVEVAYPESRPPQGQLTPEYEERARQVCAQRMFLAGLRLAAMVEKLGPGSDYQR